MKQGLVEPGVKYFIGKSLKECHIKKLNYYSFWYKMGLLAFIIIFIFLILIIMYKGKMTPLEERIKKQKEQTYILEKIKNIQELKEKQQQTIITNLPKWI